MKTLRVICLTLFALLCTGAVSGATVVKFRIHSASGGAGKVEWLPSPAAAELAKSVAFQLTGGDWQEVRVELPAEGKLGIVRLYLPAQKEPVQLDWIAIKSGSESLQSQF